MRWQSHFQVPLLLIPVDLKREERGNKFNHSMHSRLQDCFNKEYTGLNWTWFLRILLYSLGTVWLWGGQWWWVGRRGTWRKFVRQWGNNYKQMIYQYCVKNIVIIKAWEMFIAHHHAKYKDYSSAKYSTW